MTKKIFQSIFLAALIVFAASLVLIMGALYSYFSDIQLQQLKLQAGLISQGAARDGAHYFDGLDLGNYRVTWIQQDGEILYDSQSDSAAMENHLERKEIKQALLNGYGESDRYSATLTQRSFYAAKRLDDGSVLRVCATHGTIFVLLLGMSQPIVIVFAAAVALSAFLAIRLSGKIVSPLNSLDLDSPMENSCYEELFPLLRRIGSQQNMLNTQSEQLQRKQDELDAVISNMKEGIILLNQDGKILSINTVAMDLLETGSFDTGETIFSSHPGSGIGHGESSILHEMLCQALQGKASEKILGFKGSRYQTEARPIISDESISGAALLLFDISEKEKAETMRREFTANVSHELKTPLHSISGHAELLKNGFVKECDIQPFADKIYTEAQRMIQLVEDIISLSHLDEGAGGMEYEQADLYSIAASAIQSLSQKAAEADVIITLSGGPTSIWGIPQLLYGIVFNLCDNAIKYNRAGGKVSVTVKKTAKPGFSAISLTICDTGIGIPACHQEHVFERFYRVDKSHSKNLGGTGLGLSIVKHAAIIHSAAIKLHSVPDEGTCITLQFPVSSSTP